MATIKELLKCFESELSTSIGYQTREKLIQFLTQQGYTVYGGQKRLVVFEPNGYHVFKIACDLTGVQDNINEVACSEKLLELANTGKITRTDLTLFALATIEDGDPFVIKQEAGAHFENNGQFLDFYNQENQRRGGQKSYADLFPVFVNASERLSSEYNRIMTILNNYFVASDVSITREPRNYGFNPQSESLILFDMGSVIPIFTDINGTLDRPVCPHCGQHTMAYTPIQLGNNLDQSLLGDIGGQYGCLNPSCGISITKGQIALNAIIPTDQADQNVFNKYFREHMPYVNMMNLISGFSWLPLNPLQVTTIVDLRNDIYNATKGVLQITNKDDMIKIWTNYLTRSASIIISSMPEILDIQAQANGNIKDYPAFYQEISSFLAQRAPNSFETVVIRHLIATLYLRSLNYHLGKFEMYGNLVAANNLVQFREHMLRYIQMPENSIVMLFNTLKGV